MQHLFDRKGYTLIELVAVIAIIGILAAVATTQFLAKTEQVRYAATLSEMEALARAIVGNPETYQLGVSSDFGYVGDIGSLPPDLEALAGNPGFTTWDGPYIKGNFDPDDYKKDGWGVEYRLIDTLLRSTGSGENLDWALAISSEALTANFIFGYLCDADMDLPGPVYRDSFDIVLTHPDGAGGMVSRSTVPDAAGYFYFDNVPIGYHQVSLIYLPDTDTMIYNVPIEPGRDASLNIVFPSDLW